MSKKNTQLVFWSLCYVLSSHSLSAEAKTEKVKTALKIPHIHSGRQGGKVFMSGDDHVEAKMTAEGGVVLFLSDKFRDPLSIKQFEIDMSYFETGKKQPLKVTASEKSPYELKLDLPKDFSHENEVTITLKRKDPPKGYVAGSTPVKFNLMDLHSAQ